MRPAPECSVAPGVLGRLSGRAVARLQTNYSNGAEVAEVFVLSPDLTTMRQRRRGDPGVVTSSNSASVNIYARTCSGSNLVSLSSRARSPGLDHPRPNGSEVGKQFRVGRSRSQHALNRRPGGPQRSGQRNQFGHGTAIHSDPKPFSSFNPTQDVRGVISQVTRGYIRHTTTVSQRLHRDMPASLGPEERRATRDCRVSRSSRTIETARRSVLGGFIHRRERSREPGALAVIARVGRGAVA